MRVFSKDSQTNRLIRRNLVFVVVGAVIVGLVLFNLARRGLLGPIVGLQGDNECVIWKISDHNNIGGGALANKIEGTNDNPYYDDDQVIPLKRDSSGNVANLLRFQGELQYRTGKQCQ